MKVLVCVFTDNEFFFSAMVEIIASHPFLTEKYMLCKIRSDEIVKWMHTADEQNMIMAGPDMESLVRIFCLEKRWNYLTTRLNASEMQDFLVLGVNRHYERKTNLVQTRKSMKLSKQELNVLSWFLLGLTPYNMSRYYGLSVKTISTYKRRLMDKLNIKSDAELFKVGSTYRMYRKTFG
ncbi:TPA: helix-turn-helix transcriptional regulator [Enterobacter cloacae]|nr:helix-turn-helix transcriptional regulator [Enterobacter pasteurii]HBI6865194.1 helix-turn-helix transcriptional regulator [Enterobacter pasteurii]